MRRHPRLLEANARVLAARLGPPGGGLGGVPAAAWEALLRPGFDLLWLMGAWRRSPGARRAALAHEELRRAYDAALPGWREDDVAGSPYAVADYALDPALGAPADLGRLRATLARLGVGLVLDFVPNHLALDHPWVAAHPERFVCASEDAARSRPAWFFSPRPGLHVAHGRDPNFPPWTDTAQVNFFSPDMREALVGELLRIAAVADGVRCDMAMLALNDVFRGVWGWLAGDAPAGEFWGEAIARVRRRHPGFLFIAEAYWGREADLLGLGFDFAYDKTLYDRLRDGDAAGVRGHVEEAAPALARGVHFIENHDEPRAAAAFEPARARAAAVVAATLPGLRFLHDGQWEGRRVRLPVQLVREPAEAPDADTAAFYDRLWRAIGAPAFSDGEWTLAETRPADDDTHRSLLAWAWRHGDASRLVVVNFSPAPAAGWLAVAGTSRSGARVSRADDPSTEPLALPEGRLGPDGLRVSLAPWASHVLAVG